MEFAAFSR